MPPPVIRPGPLVIRPAPLLLWCCVPLACTASATRGSSNLAAARPAPAPAPAASAGHAASSPRRPAASGGRRWTPASALLRWPSATVEPFVSQGHSAGDYVADVRIQPLAAVHTYRHLVQDTRFATGTVLAVLLSRPHSTQPAWIYAMQRRGDEWVFIAARPDGARASPALEQRCIECHDAARADHVFGAPRQALQLEAAPAPAAPATSATTAPSAIPTAPATPTR